MERKLNDQAARHLASLRTKKRGQHVLQVLAAAVVFCTTYALILPAVTLANETTCGLEEHVHDIDCWTLEDIPPQPQLVCDPKNSSAAVLHQHNSYCYNDLGDLICTLPEREGHTHTADCYTLQQTLICEEAQERGHVHSDSCYTYERGALVCDQAGSGHTHSDACYQTEHKQVLTCSEAESEGHTHSDSCYTTTTHEALTCGQSESPDEVDEEGNVISVGHTHSGSCYTATEETTLTCSQSESSGHTHSDSCYSDEETHTLVCGESEGSHVHSDSCYDWTEKLHCALEETPAGHVHTEECYASSEVLTCRKEELQPHTHSDACYNADNDRVCGLPEIITHTHTAACIYIPEAEPTEGPLLTCGKEEHTHTDLCYLEKNEFETYYCGLAAHLHTEECYFESGVLRCTINEHVHEDACLIPPMAEEQTSSVYLSEDYTYETDEFRLTFHIEGYAEVPGDEEPSGEAPEETPAEDDLSDGSTSLPSSAEDGSASDGGAAEPSAPADSADGGTDPAPDTGTAAPAAAGYGYSAPTSAKPVHALDPADVAFTVESLDNGAAPETQEEYEAVLSQTEDASEEEDVLLTKILAFSAMADGVELDLSNCEVTVEVEPTPALLNSLEESANVMAVDETGGGPADGEEDPNAPVFTMTLADAEGIVAAAPIETAGMNAETAADGPVQEPKVTGRLRSKVMAASLSNQANPTFTVEYYAYLDTAKLNNGGELKVIDTSSEANGRTGETVPRGTLPQNGTDPKTKHLKLEADGSVATENSVQQIYRSHKFSYTNAPGLQYFNIVSTKTENNYSMTEIWMPVEDGETIPANGWNIAANKDGTPYVDPDVAGRQWKSRPLSDTLRFTNRRQTAEENSDYILIEDGALIRLVYKTTEGTQNYPVDFYDYDVSDGFIYSSAEDAASHSNPKNTSTQNDSTITYASVYKQGINSDSNYSSLSGAKFGFGNSEGALKSGRGDEMWKGNRINQANRDDNKISIGYENCTFGLVTGINSNSTDVIFANGITAPSLFGNDSSPVTGKTHISAIDAMQFTRSGDTYTLFSVPGTGATNLDAFESKPKWGGGTMYYNNFWPMDAAKTWGANGHDLKFGNLSLQNNRKGIGQNSNDSTILLAADNEVDHNAYFGMNFEIKFDLTEDYVGPLEYYFFGDDDMWVFLTDEEGHTRQIIDIGGVHSAVGEYVNLWDYVEKPDDRTPVDATKGDNSADAETHTYRLTFFYTERGASGSTCWMQFTLPTVVGVDLETSIKTKVDENTGALWIEKQVSGVESNLPFIFTLKLENAPDDYVIETYRRKDSGELDQTPIEGVGDNGMIIADGATFTLRPNEVLAITGLQKGTIYTITETEESRRGFHPSHQTTVTEIIRDEENNIVDEVVTPGDPQQGDTATGTINGNTVVSVVYTNLSSYELPATGGRGTAPYAISGTLLLAGLALWYRSRLRREVACS